MKIHIFGASGSGTTFLGKELAIRLGVKHFDADNYYWRKTKIPFTEKNPIENRHRLLLKDIENLDGWIISGSMDSWSKPFRPLFDCVIFLEASSEIRSKRLREREFGEYGNRILPGGDMHDEHKYFIKWAEQYEEGKLEGRNRKRHEEWMKSLECPVIRIKNEKEAGQLMNDVLEKIKRLS